MASNIIAFILLRTSSSNENIILDRQVIFEIKRINPCRHQHDQEIVATIRFSINIEPV